MYRLKTLWRKLLLCTAAAALMAAVSVYIGHTGVVRRFALERIQAWLRNTQGIVLEASDLDYNLFQSHYELKNVVLRGKDLADLPAPFRAKQVTVAVPLQDLIHGSFNAARIRIDGLSVRVVTAASGRANLLLPGSSGGCAQPGGPEVIISSAEILVQDERSGLLVQIPAARASAVWNASSRTYGIGVETSGGRFQWKDLTLPIDGVQLKSAMAGCRVSVESLRITSGTSVAEIAGALNGSPATIQATATLDMDSRFVGQALALKPQPSGPLHMEMTATGPLDGLQLSGELRSPRVSIGKVFLQNPALDAAFDAGTGELRIRSLSAGLFSGQLRATGVLSTAAKSRRSEIKATLAGVSPRQLADAFGASGFPSHPATLEVTAWCTGLGWKNTRASGTVRLATAKVGFDATLDQTRIHTLLDTSLGDNASVHGDVAIDVEKQSVAGALSGNVTSLAQLGGQIENVLEQPPGTVTLAGLDGSVRGTSTLGGTIKAPSASVHLQGSRLTFDGWNGIELDLDANYATEQIEIERAQVSWNGQHITAAGEVGGTSADARLKLQAAFASSSVAPVLHQLGVTAPVEADLSADVRIAGTISHPSAEAALHADAISVNTLSLSGAAADARWENGILTVSRFTARQDHGSTAPGQVDLSGSFEPAGGRYAGKVAATNFFVPELKPGGGPLLAGAFDVTADGEGTLAAPNLHAQITGKEIRAGEYDLGSVRVSVEATGQRGTAHLDIPALHTIATSTVELQGAWPFEFAIDATDTYLPNFPATFDATVRGKGSLATPELEQATASVRNLRLATPGQEIVGDGPVELSYAAGRIRIGHMSLKAGESTLQLSGEIPAGEISAIDQGTPGSVAVSGMFHLDSLPRFLPALNSARIAGLAELEATLHGSATHLEPVGSITVRNASFHGNAMSFPLENVAGKIDIEKGLIRLTELTGTAAKGRLRAEGSLPLRLFSDVFSAPDTNAGQPARFSAGVENAQLSASTAKHSSTATLSFEIAGEAPTLSLAALRGTIHFDELAIRTDERDLRQTAPTRITVSDAAVRLEELDLKGPNGSVHASGFVGLKDAFPVQAELAAESDLAAFSPLLQPIEATGGVRLDLHVTGTLSEPLTTGFVELNQVRLAIANPLLQADGVKLRADLEGDRVTLKDFSGILNGGRFTGGGDLKLGGGGIRDANVFLNGKDIFAEIPAGLKTNNNVDVRLVSQKDQLVLEGRIEVQEGFFESPLDLLTRSPEGLEKTAAIGTRGAASHPIGLNISVVTKRPVDMDNNLGRISGAADLRLQGTVDQPRILGSLVLEPDGRVYFGDRTYYVERGTVHFQDAVQITPELDILAYTRTNNYTIHLGLKGALNEITTTFTSDPPLSREDVISVLLTGRTVADNTGVDVRTLEAMSIATGAMNAALSSRLNRTLGVSRVSIQPSDIAAESNPGTRVTITQDFTSTFRLLYSMNLNDSSDQIWVSEYDLTRSLTTRLVKQSDNTYRGEFRHDVRFGTATNSAATAALRANRPKVSAVHFIGETPFAPEVLAKKFKVKAGNRYDSVKVRKRAERLDNFFVKHGYLESRVRLDRDDSPNGVDLTVRMEPGPTVEMTFQGANLPGRQKSKLRKLWHAGISDRQRPVAAQNAILDYFAREGYLRARVDPRVANEGNHKVVHFDMRPGIHYRDVKVVVQGSAPERLKDVHSLITKQHMEVGADRVPSRLTNAVTRYYQQRGYLAAEVAAPVFDLDADRRTGQIVIPITEGPVYHVGVIEFSGNRALNAELLRAGLPVEAGQVFEPARVDPAATAIRLKYGNLGYRTARVDYAVARHDERASVDLKFAVVENKQTSIRSISVTGNRQTSVKFVEGRLVITQGQLADASKIRESVANLSRTGAYAAANIEVASPEADSTAKNNDKDAEAADVTVTLAEPKPFRLLYGGLYDNGSGPGFIFDFQNHNTLGPGRTLGFRARYDAETKEGRVYLTQPYWGLKPVHTTISTYYTDQVPYGQNYPTARGGVGFQQDWPLRAKLLLSYGIRFEKERAWLPVNGVEVRTPIVFAAPITFTISRDVRDSFLDATRGSFTSHSFEFAPKVLGTEYRYIRYYLQYFKYFPLTQPRPAPYGETPNRSRLVFATGVRIGLQKGLNPQNLVLTDRFYAGGGTTVRGFQQDSLGPKLANGAPIGGNAVFILNNEIRYPLFRAFDAVSFVDIGNVFPQVSDFRFSDLRFASGFGLRVRNPFVVLRFDYGFKLDRRPGDKIGAFFFSIGQAF
jgi:outer membrane protein assembly complex protein YaeT